MRRRAFHVFALAGLGLVSLAVGCKKADSILLVELYGPHSTGTPQLRPFQFLVTVSAGGGSPPEAFNIPKEPHASPLPQSFSLTLDASHTGPVTISVTANGEDGVPIAEGTTTQEHIVIGGETIISVNLVPIDDAGPLPGNDGGAGDSGDASQDPSDAGLGLDDASD
jgi:hypothetical protein